MKRGVLMLALSLVACGAAHALDTARYRYERALETSGGLTVFEPDGPMFAHAAYGFGDLRILDAKERQVPWRIFGRSSSDLPPHAVARVLNAGREGSAAVALLDFGRAHVVRDRIELDLPARPFVGHADVFGSDDRRNFTRLSSTAIYDVRGAQPARSTAVVFPASDFRYFRVRATGVPAIRGATAEAARERPKLVQRAATIDVRQLAGRTVVTADLAYRQTPVHEIRFASATPAFDRPVDILGSNDGRTFAVVGAGRIYRFAGRGTTTVPVNAAVRQVRIRIHNGDDLPLRRLRVTLLARPVAILLAPGFAPPYRVLYGGPPDPPEYDFAEQPAPKAEPQRASLGPERRAAGREDTRSFIDRNDWLVQAALGLAAIVLAAVAFLAIRRRA